MRWNHLSGKVLFLFVGLTIPTFIAFESPITIRNIERVFVFFSTIDLRAITFGKNKAFTKWINSFFSSQPEPVQRKCTPPGVLASNSAGAMSYVSFIASVVTLVLNINNNINANNNNNNRINLNYGSSSNVVSNLNQNVGNNFNLMFPPGKRRRRSPSKKIEAIYLDPNVECYGPYYKILELLFFWQNLLHSFFLVRGHYDYFEFWKLSNTFKKKEECNQASM